VELSIVLIIIGLIVGGVLGGQSLIKSAELQRVVNEFRQYETAINAFRLEFNSLPGDMNNAKDYWTSCVDSGTNTCNGDGEIKGACNSNLTEDTRAWQHMSLAGIVPGNYTGVSPTEKWVYCRKPGETVPSSYANDLGIYTYWGDGSWLLSKGTVKNLPEGDDGKKSEFVAVLSPKKMKQIDTKLDDGKPLVGRFLAELNGTGTEDECFLKSTLPDKEKSYSAIAQRIVTNLTTENFSGVKYNLSDNTPRCFSFYKIM